MKGTSLVIKSMATSITHDLYNFTIIFPRRGVEISGTKGQFALQGEKSLDFSWYNLYNICTIFMVHDVAT